MRINLISNPRNVSTALMYSFAQRADMSVIDEPFYGYYLNRNNVQHPGRQEILDSMPLTVPEVMDAIANAHHQEHLFIKGMAHHLEGVDLSVLNGMVNLLFIRDPRQIIASFAQVIPEPTLNDIGLGHQVELARKLTSTGERVVVLESGKLLEDPPQTLNLLCRTIGLNMDRSMLSWNTGGIPEDGIWAPYWYANVHRSTGFATQKSSSRPFPDHCQDLLEQALPIYEELMVSAI